MRVDCISIFNAHLRQCFKDKITIYCRDQRLVENKQSLILFKTMKVVYLPRKKIFQGTLKACLHRLSLSSEPGVSAI